jgi:hypothetical protein
VGGGGQVVAEPGDGGAVGNDQASDVIRLSRPTQGRLGIIHAYDWF